MDVRIVRGAGLLALASVVGAGLAQAQTAAPDDKTRQLYQARCAMCHGADGVPKPVAKTAASFADPAWAPATETIVAVVTDGKGTKMPKFKGRLTPEEIQALAGFLLKLKDAPKP
jgi:mono/diheme cytochrome c family protein